MSLGQLAEMDESACKASFTLSDSDPFQSNSLIFNNYSKYNLELDTKSSNGVWPQTEIDVSTLNALPSSIGPTRLFKASKTEVRYPDTANVLATRDSPFQRQKGLQDSWHLDTATVSRSVPSNVCTGIEGAV